MGIEYREELVGKRFLCVVGNLKPKTPISEWPWRAGIIRAVDKSSPAVYGKEAVVYVEFDDQDWDKREWLRISNKSHQAFLVEKTAVWAERVDPYAQVPNNVTWPALSFKALVDRCGFKDSPLKPVEFFLDNLLDFYKKADIEVYKESPRKSANKPIFKRYEAVKSEFDRWLHEQKEQHILMKAPYGLSGYRIKVYRIGSTTQWFTAVITGHDLMTRDLIVMDDTVLESHTENPAHVHMMFLDDVVNSLLKGENVGITSRRRAAAAVTAASSTSQTSSLTTFSRSLTAGHQPVPSSAASYPVPHGPKKRKTNKGANEGSTDQELKEKQKVVRAEKPVKAEKPSVNRNKKDRKRKPEEVNSEDRVAKPEIPKKTRPNVGVAGQEPRTPTLDPKGPTHSYQGPREDSQRPTVDPNAPAEDPNSLDPIKVVSSHQTVDNRLQSEVLHKSSVEGQPIGPPRTVENTTHNPQSMVAHSDISICGTPTTCMTAAPTSTVPITVGPTVALPSPKSVPVPPKNGFEQSHRTRPDNVISGKDSDGAMDLRETDVSSSVSTTWTKDAKPEQSPTVRQATGDQASGRVTASSNTTKMGTSASSDPGFLLKLSHRRPKTGGESPFTNAIAGIIARELSRDNDSQPKKVGSEELPPPVKEQTSTTAISSAVPSVSTMTAFSAASKLYSPIESMYKARVSAQEAVMAAVPSVAMIKDCLLKTTIINPKPSQTTLTHSNPGVVSTSKVASPNNRTYPLEVDARLGGGKKGAVKPARTVPLTEVHRSSSVGPPQVVELDLRKDRQHAGTQDRTDKLKRERELRDLQDASARYEASHRSKEGHTRAHFDAKGAPVKVFRDPNLRDNPVTHVRSIQHNFSHPQGRKQSGHTHLSSSVRNPTVAAAPSPHSGAHPGSPSAFIPSNLHANALQTLLPPHLAMYAHPMGGLPYNLLHPHVGEMMAQQDALTRLRHQQAVLLQTGALTPAQLQVLLQGQHHIAIPPGMLISQPGVTQEELEMAHRRSQREQQKLHAENLAQLETKAILHADKHLFSTSPHPPRPQPTSSAGSGHVADMYRSGELRNNSHSDISNHRDPSNHRDLPMVDVHAAIERHFQESLGKPPAALQYNLPSGSITRGTPMPKTDPRIAAADKELQHKEQLEQERLRREREEKELEWQRLQQEKEYKQNQIQREMERNIMFPGPGMTSERERAQKLATSMEMKNDDSLFKHVMSHLKPKYSGLSPPDRKTDKTIVGDVINSQTSSAPGFQVFQPYKLGPHRTSGLKYEEARPGIPVRPEHNRLKLSPSYMSAFQVKPHHLEGYVPFGHTVISTKGHEEKVMEGTQYGHRGPTHSPHSRTHSPHGPSSHSPLLLSHSPHSATHSPHGSITEKDKKGIPHPPPLIKKEPGLANHEYRLAHEYRREAHTIQEVGARSLWEKQIGKPIGRVGKPEGTKSVPVIVRRSEPGRMPSHTQASSPLKVASPQQLSRAALQPMEVKTSRSSASQPSPAAKNVNCSSALPASQSILMSALRPAEQQHRTQELQEPGGGQGTKRKSPKQPMAVKKRVKDSVIMGVAERDFRKAGAVTSFSEHCQSYQTAGREQGPFISGSTTHAKVSENVELKIEKVDQLKRVSADAAGSSIHRVMALTNSFTKNGSLSDSERSRSASPQTMSDSSDSRRTSSPNRTHVKCKKAWIQRLSESTDSPPPQELSKEAPPKSLPNGHVHSMDSTCTAAVERHVVVSLSDIQRSIPGKVYDFDNTSTCSESSSTSSKQRQKRSRENKRTRRRTGSPVASESPILQQNGVGNNSKVDAMGDHHKQVTASIIELMSKAPKKRIITRANKDKEAFSLVRTLTKPALAKLKRSGEPFLQDGPCTNITPTLMKCRECRMKGNKQSRLNIFCRFYAFRRLRFSQKGNLTIAGFSEMDQYDKEDLSPWLPSWLGEDPANDVEVSKYIMMMLADKFCELVLKEKEAKRAMPVHDGKITWKRPVAGVREMCDTCDTTLFNIHWTCSKCGFVVCYDCLKAKKGNSTRYQKAKSPEVWLKCIKDQQHLPENLMLTQIIPGTALWDIGTLVHEIRSWWKLPLTCPCKPHATQGEAEVTNGQCVDRESEEAKENRDRANPIVSTTGTLTASSSTSALDFLADVATSQSNDANQNLQNGVARVDSSTDVKAPVAAADITTNAVTDPKGDEKSCSTLRELLTKTASRMGTPGGPLDGSSFLSALIPKNNESRSKHRTLTSTFEDIIATVVEQHIADPRGRRQEHSNGGKTSREVARKPQTGSKNTLTESSFLYPDVPHSWLCEGRLLLLHEPANKDNFKIFQEQWGKGSPVLVSNVHTQLKREIWLPSYFGERFGPIENDLVDCRRGTVIQGAPMKDFWDGFEDLSNRLETKGGVPMILKLKDWPPAADFAEMLPEHFEDVMENLPLPEYTRREGVLNLSSRLPDFFVKPDLGPKMYNAYGIARYPSVGTTNLHLDISDAVNVMVHVEVPHGGDEEGDTAEELRRETSEAVEYHCKDEQTLRRMREGKEIPGAMWHIFKAEDTPKIRAFLNMLSQEQGEKLLQDHDPIHDQSWYIDNDMLKRLKEEYNVEGWTIIQFQGDAIFIPAGTAHQVQNLNSCIKVAEDFVSPEHIKECICLTDEFRHLSNTHSNHEDKLQIKNILYHAIKDAAGVLMGHDPLLQGMDSRR